MVGIKACQGPSHSPQFQDSCSQNRLKNGPFSPQNGPPHGTTARETPHRTPICNHSMVQFLWRKNGSPWRPPLDIRAIVLNFQDDLRWGFRGRGQIMVRQPIWNALAKTNRTTVHVRSRKPSCRHMPCAPINAKHHTTGGFVRDTLKWIWHPLLALLPCIKLYLRVPLTAGGGGGGAQKVRCGPATVLQPRLPSHGLHRLPSSIRVRPAIGPLRCTLSSLAWAGSVGGGGGGVSREPPHHRQNGSGGWIPIPPPAPTEEYAIQLDHQGDQLGRGCPCYQTTLPTVRRRPPPSPPGRRQRSDQHSGIGTRARRPPSPRRHFGIFFFLTRDRSSTKCPLRVHIAGHGSVTGPTLGMGLV